MIGSLGGTAAALKHARNLPKDSTTSVPGTVDDLYMFEVPATLMLCWEKLMSEHEGLAHRDRKDIWLSKVMGVS